MKNLSKKREETGRIEGQIHIDTGKRAILEGIANAKDLIDALSNKLSDANDDNTNLMNQLEKSLEEELAETKTETLNKLREEESSLTAIRKTLARLDSNQEKQRNKQEEIIQTVRKLQDEIIFKEKISPGVTELIKARDNLIGQISDLDESRESYMFLETLDLALEKTLAEFGVEEVETDNSEKFDPEYQEIVSKEKTLESRNDGKVAEVIKPGYIRNGKLIRPQLVKVLKFKGGSNE